MPLTTDRDWSYPDAPPLRPLPGPPVSAYWEQAPTPVATPLPRPSHAGRNAALVILVGLFVLAGSFLVGANARTWFSDTTVAAPYAAPSGRAAPTTTAPSLSSPSPTSPAAPSSPSSPKTPSSPSPSPPSSPASPSGNWDTVAAAIDPGVVDIESRLPQGIGAGTGIVLSDSGEILTNNHVIDGATQIAVTVVTTGDTYDADVVGTDPTNDIAVLHLVGASGLATIPLGDSDGVKVGDPVAAIGNAGGQGGDPTVASGAVTSLHQKITASDPGGANMQTLTDMIQVNADVQPGDSGGPLVSADAKVIGIDAAASEGRSRYRTQSHEGFAIPINRALTIAKKLEANPNGGSGSGASGGSGKLATGRGFLGVQLDSASNADGAAVAGVQAGSPAAKAGLQAGDVITALDDNAIGSTDDLTSALTEHQGGDQITVAWERNGTQHHASITLASR